MEIEVLSSEGGIAIGSLDFENTASDFEEGDIESTSTQIVDCNHLAISLIKTESEGGSGGLIDDSLDLQVGDLASIFSRLSLGVVEVSRHGDDSLFDGLPEVRLSSLLHLDEHESANLRGRVLLASGFDPSVAIASSHYLIGQLLKILLGVGVVESAPNESLGSEHGVLGVGHCLTLSRDTYESLTIFGKGYSRGGCSLA